MRKSGDFRILVLLPIEFTYGRALLSGILQAVRRHPGLRVRLARNATERQAALESPQPYLAAIGLIWSREEVEELRRRCRTIISFANKPPFPADRHLILDDRAVGREAAREFREMGLKACAVLMPENHHYMKERASGFLEGFPANHRPRPQLIHRYGAAVRLVKKRRGEGLGLFVVNDAHARLFLDRCEGASIAIPECASILGVDDDEIAVHLGPLLLSSIPLPFERMGEGAVESLMAPAGSLSELVEFAPLPVVHRQTTSGFHHYPPLVQRYLELLQRARPMPATVGEACRLASIPRRSLESACRKALDQSPHDLLQDWRKRLLQQLVAEGMPLEHIAAMLGYQQTRSLRSLGVEKAVREVCGMSGKRSQGRGGDLIERGADR